MSARLEDYIAMKKRIFRVLVCFVLLFMAVTLTACANETVALQARIDTLEGENSELQSTISSLRADLEKAQSDLSNTQNELLYVQVALEAAEDAQAAQQGDQGGALAITYGGEPNQDMSWPLSYGNLTLGLRVNLSELDEEVEIVWRSTDESVFTVSSSEDGTSATVTPITTGSAQLVVTVDDQETRSWVRVT